ncbi:hypothetical protein TYRP_021001 [Tyrophagus putrescentiae]|nr:hypothetical protein TYRP_021001 [Tyrophagus putrescentiae]
MVVTGVNEVKSDEMDRSSFCVCSVQIRYNAELPPFREAEEAAPAAAFFCELPPVFFFADPCTLLFFTEDFVFFLPLPAPFLAEPRLSFGGRWGRRRRRRSDVTVTVTLVLHGHLGGVVGQVLGLERRLGGRLRAGVLAVVQRLGEGAISVGAVDVVLFRVFCLLRADDDVEVVVGGAGKISGGGRGTALAFASWLLLSGAGFSSCASSLQTSTSTAVLLLFAVQAVVALVDRRHLPLEGANAAARLGVLALLRLDLLDEAVGEGAAADKHPHRHCKLPVVGAGGLAELEAAPPVGHASSALTTVTSTEPEDCLKREALKR